MTIIDWVIIVIPLFTLALQITVLVGVRNLQKETKSLRVQLSSRQKIIAKRTRASYKAPRIDSRATTSKRDTDDLPLTGRMSQVVRRTSTRSEHGHANDS